MDWKRHPTGTWLAIAVLTLMATQGLALLVWLILTQGGITPAIALLFGGRPLAHGLLAAGLARRARWAWWATVLVAALDLLQSLVGATYAAAVTLQGDFASSGRTVVGVLSSGLVLLGLLHRGSRAAFVPRAGVLRH